MAPTKSAGRVSIRVLPDSTRFREDLKKTLDRIEDTMRVKIQVNPVFDKRQLAELKRQIEALKVTIRPDIDLSVPTGDIERIKESIEAMSPMVEINTKVNTAAAAARINALSRDRMVMIHTILSKAAVNNFTKHLAAISGASFIAKEIEKGMRFLRTIDQHAVQLAKQATLLGGVISLANGAVQAVFALGDGLISTLGVLTVAPALMASMGIAMAVFSVVLKDMKDVLADLGPSFTVLADEMSFAFWEEAAQPIRELANELMPTLSEKMILASVSMGKLTGQIAKSYKEHVTIEKFATMFDRVLESMDTVRGAVDPIIEAFTILGMHGTQYLNRLSLSIVKLTEDFRDWLKVSEENGNLARWTEEAIQAFKDLGGIIGGVWNVFGALNSAIKEAGGPTLATLHANLDSLASMMQDEMFQRSMTAVFRGMNVALADIGQAVINLGPALASMAQVIELSFVSIGDTISIVLGYLGEIISHPAVRGGLLDFFEGINKAVVALAPAIEPFSLALGSLLTLLGTVVENVGELVSTIMTEWGPSLQRLSDTFDTLAEPLRVMLEDVVKALTPAIEVLINDAIIPLLEWIRDHLIPAVSDFARDSGPAMVKIAEGIGSAITDHLLPALTILTDLFTDAEGEASGFKKTLDGLEQLINDPESFMVELPGNYMEFSHDVDNFFIDWWDGMMDDAESHMNGDKDYWSDYIGDWFIDAGKGIGKSWDDMWKNVDWTPDIDAELAVSLGEIWQNVEDWWADIEKGWNDFWGGFGDRNAKIEEIVDEEGLQMATAGIDIDLGKLKENFTQWWTDVSEGWTGFWEGVGTNSETGMADLREGFGIWWEDVKTGFATWWEDIKTGWSEFWTGFGESAAIKWGEIKTGMSEWWAGITEGFATWWEEIKVGWEEFWTGFGETVATWWENLKTGFDEWWNGIKDGFKTWWEDIKAGWGEFWDGIGTKTEEAWEDIKTTIKTWIDDIKTNIQTWFDDLGIETDSGWSIIKGLTSVAWDAIKNWLATKWQEIKNNVKVWLSGLGIDVDSGWNSIKGITAMLWAQIKQVIADKWNEIVNFVPGKLQEFGNHVRNGFENAKQGAREKMQELKQGVIDKAQEVIDWIRDLPNKMRNAMSGQSLSSSGSSLIQGFKDGMIAKANEAYEAAKGILAKIRNLFPASPAKEGPFSGKGWTPYSGAALVDGFSQGMESRMSSAVRVAHRMTKGVAGEFSNMKLDKFEPGLSEGSDGNVTVKIYNPIAEPSSRTIARASSMIKLGGKP